MEQAEQTVVAQRQHGPWRQRERRVGRLQALLRVRRELLLGLLARCCGLGLQARTEVWHACLDLRDCAQQGRGPGVVLRAELAVLRCAAAALRSSDALLQAYAVERAFDGVMPQLLPCLDAAAARSWAEHAAALLLDGDADSLSVALRARLTAQDSALLARLQDGAAARGALPI